MKLKVIIAIVLCLTVLFLTSCSAGKSTSNTAAVQTTAASQTSQEPETEASVKDMKVDVDLTNLSSTMVYSKVYEMLTKPEDYVGKTVKMKGTFAVYNGTQYREHYFACVISDATACCQQGMEFRLKDGASYPDDYPIEGKTITVVGTFTTYMEGEKKYVELVDSSIAA